MTGSYLLPVRSFPALRPFRSTHQAVARPADGHPAPGDSAEFCRPLAGAGRRPGQAGCWTVDLPGDDRSGSAGADGG